MSVERERLQFKQNTVRVDSKIVPWLKKNEQFDMGIAHFPDHGRPCFIGSAIKSSSVILALARELTPDESRRVNERFRMEIEKILNGEETKITGVLSAREDNRPDVNKISLGDPYDPKGLRIYYSKSEFMGTPSVYLLAVARLKDSGKVERMLETAGYRGSKNWENRKIH